jgi:hypothetical protein
MYSPTSTRALRVTGSLLLLLLIAAFISSTARAQAQSSDFTVIVVPDTQEAIAADPTIVNTQMQWIVTNAPGRNIRFVLGVGDIVDSATSSTQWARASAAYKFLDDAGIPYLTPPGNKEYESTSARTLSNYNVNFGASRFGPWYGGHYGSGAENSYFLTTINGDEYLALSLEMYPRDAALDWAAGIVAAHPNAEVMITTHSFINTGGTRTTYCGDSGINAEGYGLGTGNDGEELWAKFIALYPRISLVVNGHFASSNTGLGAAARIDLGVNANLVNQMLADYQAYPVTSTGSGTGQGYLRILTFSKSNNTISVETYSPVLDTYMTDAANKFTVPWHASGTPAPGTGTITGSVRRAPPDCTTLTSGKVSAGSIAATITSSGKYTLNLPAPGTYTVTVQDGASEVTRELKAWPGYPAYIKLFPSPTGVIVGSITYPNNAPVSGAAIRFVGGTALNEKTITADTVGNFSSGDLGIGPYRVIASTNDANVTMSATVQAGATTTLPITMNYATGSLRGTVTDAGSGAVLAGATVSYDNLSVATDASGNYAFTSVSATTHQVTAAKAGYSSVTKTVTVTNSETFADFALAALPGAIHGTVSAGGAPVSGATVSYSGGTTTTGSGGAYSFPGVAPGTYTVTAAAAGCPTASASVAVAPGGDTVANFAFAVQLGTISGFVRRHLDNQPISGATVSFSGRVTTTTSTGSYKFANVTPGIYTVKSSAKGFVTASQSVTVGSGATASLNFSLLAVGYVDGYVKTGTGAAFANATVRVYSGTSVLSTVAANASGYYKSGVLAPGTSYKVTASKSGYNSASATGVAVTEGGTTRISDLVLK